MFVLGLLLVLLAALVTVAVVVGGANDPSTYSLGAVHVSMNVLAVFLLGALTLLVLMVGVAMIRRGTVKAAQRRKDSRRLKKLQAQEAERERLERERAAERESATGTGSGTTTSPPATTGTTPGTTSGTTSGTTPGSDPTTLDSRSTATTSDRPANGR